MNPELAIESSREAIKVCMLIGGPILGVCLVVGLVLGLVQAMSQIQDQAISAVPKILAVLAAVGLALPWMSEHLGDYAKDQFGNPNFGGGTVARVPAESEKKIASRIVVSPASFKKESSPYYPSLDATPVAPAVQETLPEQETRETPFELPHYRFSRLPGKNKEG